MHSIDDEPVAAPADARPTPPPTPATSPRPQASPTPDAEEWTVELGDHLWGIAAEVVAETDLHPDDHTIARYWTRLIDANRPRLVDPDNPDLLLPGQVLVLPPRAA
jgi:nucleoid-associated protein YgaU